MDTSYWGSFGQENHFGPILAASFTLFEHPMLLEKSAGIHIGINAYPGIFARKLISAHHQTAASFLEIFFENRRPWTFIR